jgi:hypothetical protein
MLFIFLYKRPEKMAAVTRPAPAAARIIPVFGNTGETDYRSLF